MHQMSDDQFESYSDKLVRTERKITKRVLDMINECIRRRHYAKMNCDSIFTWLTKCRGYSNQMADRRLKAASLLRAVPEVAQKIQGAEVNLTTLSQLQHAIRKEEKRTGARLKPEQKRELVAKIENQTSDKAAQILAQEFPEAVKTDERVTRVSAELSKSTMYFTNEQKAKLQRLREVLSHSHFEATNVDLLFAAVDFMLDAKDPLREKPKDVRREKEASNSGRNTPKQWYWDESYCQKVTSVAEMKRIVLLRGGGCCQYRSKQTGETCGSRFQVQIDHIKPKALGGRDEISNFRPLCRTHNLLMAEIAFGVSKMALYRGIDMQIQH